MAREWWVLEINGEEDADLNEDVAGLEVELSDDAPALFHLSLRLSRAQDGSWLYVDDERFRPWSEVVIRLGYADAGPGDVLTGYVTQTAVHFAADEKQALIEAPDAETRAALIVAFAERGSPDERTRLQ
jgi:hypothetical protein